VLIRSALAWGVSHLRVTGSLLLAVVFLAGACDPIPIRRQIGIEGGQPPLIHYVTCADESVEAVELFRVTDDEEELLWRISRADVSVERFPVGATRDGFREDEPLLSPLNEEDTYMARVETDQSGAVLAFQLQELRAARVLTSDDDLLSHDEYLERAHGRCA
jgi:hypothetical protein